MPATSASCIVPDSNGLLWICTNSGLVRFDGYRFHVFGPEEGLPSRRIIGFVVSRHGGYWVTTDVGVCRLPPGSKVGDPCRLLIPEAIPGEFLANTIVETDDGRTYMVTSDRLFRVSADGRKLEPTPIQREVRFMLLTVALLPDGRFLIGTESSLLLWRDGEKPEKIGPEQLRFGMRHIAVAPKSRGNAAAPQVAWLSGTDGIYRVSIAEGSAPRLQRAAPTLSSSRCAVLRHDGSLWVGTSSGLSRLVADDDGILHETVRYTAHEGLPTTDVEDLAEDYQGNLWGVGDASGIFRIANGGFTTYNGDDGLGTARVSSIFEDVDGRLCVTVTALPGEDTNLRVRNGDRFQPVSLGHHSGWGWNQFGFQARDREWWFPSGEGLYRFPPTRSPFDLPSLRSTKVYGPGNALRGAEIFRVFEDSHGDVWVSTLSETDFARWDRRTGEFHHFTAAEGWPLDDCVSVIREAAGGTFWIGTFHQVVRYRNGRFETFRPFPEDPPSYVRDLYVDHAGRVWVATARSGLFRCDNPEAAVPVFHNYSTRQGLSAESVRSLTEDAAGFIYVGTIRGVDRIDPRLPVSAFGIRHFTTADGLPDSEQNVAFRDRRGHLWFGTLNGLAEFDPSVDRGAAPPEIYITRIRSRGVDIPLPWEGARRMSVALTPDRNQLDIEYSGIDLRSVASLRYQYRLRGEDSAWSPPTEQMSVNYTSLPSGRLGFDVRAIDADGQVSPSVSLDLAVQAPVWRRWWFLTLAALLAGAAISTLYNYRVRQLLAMERLRTRIATDLHDDIGASLTQISILSELARRNPSRDALSDVADIARQLVEDMNDIVWAVNPRHDHFEALVHRMRRFASDMLSDLDLQFHAEDLPPDLKIPLDYRRPLFLIFKEAVNNVARHAGATAASVRVAVEASAVKLIVEDNGRGFDPTATARGEGLGSLRKRVRDLGGTAEWTSMPGRGTRFEAVLPLRNRGSLHELGGIFAAFRR